MITDSSDILTELLLRLPAKSLIRFKLVSKRWLCLISSPRFSRLHATRYRLSKPELSLLLCLPQTPHHYYYLQPTLSKLVPYRFPSTFKEPIVCSSSNDLFLLQCNSAPQECHVYNPTTKQSRRIALSTNEMYPISVGLNVVFDPLKSPHYKIFCVRFARRRISGFLGGRPRRCQMEVYESGTCTWKLCGGQFFAPSNLDYNHGIYWNNGIHWSGVFFDFDDNIAKEHPRLMVVPEYYGVSTCKVNYVERNGSLLCIAHYHVKKLVLVFELQKDYSKWLLKHRIYLDPCFGSLSVLAMVEENGKDDCTLLVHKPGRIMAYATAEKSYKEVIDFEEGTTYQENGAELVSGFTCQFFETLSLV